MWWELLKYPADDPRAQIYWRRRLSVLAVAVTLVLLFLVLVVHSGGGSSGHAQPAAAEVPVAADPAAASPASPGPLASPGAPAGTTPTPSPSTSPGAPTPSPSAGPSTAAANPATTCTDGTMALRLASDAPSYSGGRQPVLALSVVDVGNTPCTVDLGTKTTAISVLSNGHPIWTSNGCADRVARPVQLTPAAAQTLQLRWDLSSNTSGCGASSSTPAKGPYEIVARVGSAAVYGGSFQLQ
jgi:hypothetical protein